jgi:protein TonB
VTGTYQRFDISATADRPPDLDRVVPARDRAEAPPVPATAWSNVVPFVRPRAEAPPADAAPKLIVSTADRPAPDLTGRETRARILTLVGLSLLVHAGLYLVANREPEPMASIGLEAISVELVLGANAPAAASTTPTEIATPTTPPPVQQTEPERTEVQEQKPPDQTAAAPPDATPQTPPPPEAQPQPPEPEPPAPPEAVQPQEPVKPEPKPAPKQETKPKPAPKHEAKPKTAPKREATRTETPAPRANAANGGGAQRSANDANYRGTVAAHLARYKRFPPEAERSGAQGSASVRFTVSGSGSVTSVSLVHGTGVAALDQEAVAMVHRASPFPAPPNGRPVSFTVPVSYKMR